MLKATRHEAIELMKQDDAIMSDEDGATLRWVRIEGQYYYPCVDGRWRPFGKIAYKTEGTWTRVQMTGHVLLDYAQRLMEEALAKAQFMQLTKPLEGFQERVLKVPDLVPFGEETAATKAVEDAVYAMSKRLELMRAIEGYHLYSLANHNDRELRVHAWRLGRHPLDIPDPHEIKKGLVDIFGVDFQNVESDRVQYDIWAFICNWDQASLTRDQVQKVHALFKHECVEFSFTFSEEESQLHMKASYE
jgi:hypothetical protein